MTEQARAHGTVVLAMSADGKIADRERSPARFGSTADRLHLETQMAQADGVLFGAETLRTYGTTLRITQPDLLQQRQQQDKFPQPIHIVCSSSGRLDPECRFFQQAVPRWLMTTPEGAMGWSDRPEFERVLVACSPAPPTNWHQIFQQLAALGLEKIVVTGGGQLVASLLEAGVIDEIWLTVCPLILGGAQSPTPVDGYGFPAHLAPRLELLSTQVMGSEVFLHYYLQSAPPPTNEEKLN
ncbi:MAG: RibD family protein [Drouetiella hepatica Uher 2000/2452]|jgi:5-amino-6-(5-phosphoribosylamino)uracil reductase|uniref:RibD family protein n=1 Tax=Drouetiella hepatica Uher 2000/2452 TaxID=904376 RepID=A0A951QAR4_9CYAN|nr:RibD family protein [Drouetiella hepatica Uher 2000/2452]